MPEPAQPSATNRRLALALREGRGTTTQEVLARRMGVSTRTVVRAERGERPPTAAFVNLWLATIEVDDELRTTIRELFRAVSLEARQHLSGAHGADAGPALASGITTRIVADEEVAAAVNEAHAIVDVMRHPAQMTTGTLDALQRSVHDLDAAWSRSPLPQVFRQARALRNEVVTCFSGRLTDGQRLALATVGGLIHAHLTEALLDLGHFTAAWSQTSAGLVLAKAAGAAELHVVLHAQRSRIRYWQGSYDVAALEAQAGAAWVRPRSPAAVKLFDKLALAAARTGDAAAARSALHACEEARDAADGASYLAPASEEFCSMGAAYSLVILGDFPAARSHARHAVARYEARNASSINLTFARLGLAKAEADAATAAGVGAAAIEAYLRQPRRSQMIVVAARQLDARLPDGVVEVQDFRERLHALEASTRHVMPGM